MPEVHPDFWRPNITSLDILVLDNDRDGADTLAKVLHRRLNNSVLRVFYDPHLAAAAVVERAPDIIVSDLEMPGMDGHKFALVVRIACGATQPPLLIAASGSAVELASASRLGVFDHFFTKPLDFEAVVKLINNSTPAARVTPAEQENCHRFKML